MLCTMADGVSKQMRGAIRLTAYHEVKFSLLCHQSAGGMSAAYEADVRPAYVLLVDATGGPAFVDLISGALLAAMEGMPECSLIGLATFSAEVLHHFMQDPFLMNACMLASCRCLLAAIFSALLC